MKRSDVGYVAMCVGVRLGWSDTDNASSKRKFHVCKKNCMLSLRNGAGANDNHPESRGIHASMAGNLVPQFVPGPHRNKEQESPKRGDLPLHNSVPGPH